MALGARRAGAERVPADLWGDLLPSGAPRARKKAPGAEKRPNL